ncbi:ABC transporter permease [Bythopirellula goksoeyrii]|uniref:Putative ABC transporter ATP-binding protein YbhF n=1 Tax=Bythopirellula goksoeyrii TaxID=1400387 RepID=A0A5B9QA88_9BACT|nr:ABC transporter permease [Bythopirellula goksoeyrii]QEG34545.1 putative ABC transporter ATP-binding protein YbhF [Bythopirellula goksoeyrii]
MSDQSSAVVIDVHELSRSFGELVAVRDVSFQVQRASIFGLLGPNGSGKSTIIRMLLGILSPTSGSANVLGYDAERDAEQIKRRVGYMSQQFSLYADLSVRENIEFYGRIYGLSSDRIAERQAVVLGLTGLEDRLDQLAGTLSGGWKQRLALACSLIHDPEILFLDEPTAGIDPVARRQLWDLLFELSGRGVTLFVTTHYMDEAERCTDVGYIYMSQLLVLGKPSDLKSLPAVSPAGSRRYELRVPRPAERLSEIRKLDGVRDATLFGETVHVMVDEHLTPKNLAAELSTSVDEADIREVPPTLEDVFVTLTKNAQEDTVPPEPIVPAPDNAQGLTVSQKVGLGVVPPEAPAPPTKRSRPFAGLLAILVKEFYHIRRQPSTIFFMLVVPVMQTIIFGYAIDIQVEHIPMVVFNMDGRQPSQQLVDSFVNTRRFDTVAYVEDDDTFHHWMATGDAKVGMKIPPYYSDRLLRGEQVEVQVLIDGSDSQVATTALNTSQLLGVNLSLQLAKQKAEAVQLAPARDPTGKADLPIDIRPRLLYNPDLESDHFFVPGLVGIILQLVTLFLTSFAIVRERELGTLEQLFVTPVSRAGLLLGKLIPYAIVGFIETLIMLTVMIYLFGVPIRGSVGLLLSLSMLFMVCSLGLGLLVSTIAKSQVEAVQFAFIVMLPSVLLSGFVFPRSQMPLPIYLITFAIPATYFIEILRGIVLRGAGLMDLVPMVTGLTICAIVVLTISVTRFRKQLE